ncbi:MAG TPA: SDR family NAD(P)-dependent oxidoreductase, partial [Jatrophihabitans sp.]|nr:SDR family NAD(P)-dependent oxidoreductase [Jatrophihabitans sp.]
VGAALVDALLDRGAAKVYAGARDPSSLTAAAERHGDRLVPVRLDVTNRADVDAAAAACPDVEILVSNAGLAPAGPVLETGDALIREVFEVNVFGPLALVGAFAPALTRTGGGLLFINSVTGLIVSRSSPVYGASKAAARMLALGLREELRGSGVVVTTSHPGFIDTDMAAAVPYPKASPRSVADASLDGLAAEKTVVFGDALAELVEDALVTRMPDVLTEPQRLMTELTGRLSGPG